MKAEYQKHLDEALAMKDKDQADSLIKAIISQALSDLRQQIREEIEGYGKGKGYEDFGIDDILALPSLQDKEER